MGFKRTFEAVKVKTFRARLLDGSGNYITIRISITRNIRYFNVIFSTSHLFSDT